MEHAISIMAFEWQIVLVANKA